MKNTLYPHLMDELLVYGKEQKARHVYYKCLRNRKYELASEIYKKYNLRLRQSDLVMAISLSLINIKK